MQKGTVVLEATILDKVLETRGAYYLITKIKEIGTAGGMKYFDIRVKEYNTEKKEVYPGTEEIELTLPENVIEKADDVSVIKTGMLGFNNNGILKIFNRSA